MSGQNQQAWPLEAIKKKLREIKSKDFISIPDDMYRGDEGVIGQLIEKEFGIVENNLSVADLGKFELKGMRVKSQTLTMSHKKPEIGLSPTEIFERFGYVKPSKRDPSVLKKKLFTTIKGNRVNNLGFCLTPKGVAAIEMFHHGENGQSEKICEWDLTGPLKKMQHVILAFAETEGKTGTNGEKFRFVEAWLMTELRPLSELIKEELLVIDFCIDKVVGDIRAPHDRGPHMRIPKRKLAKAYQDIQVILPRN